MRDARSALRLIKLYDRRREEEAPAPKRSRAGGGANGRRARSRAAKPRLQRPRSSSAGESALAGHEVRLDPSDHTGAAAHRGNRRKRRLGLPGVTCARAPTELRTEDRSVPRRAWQVTAIEGRTQSRAAVLRKTHETRTRAPVLEAHPRCFTARRSRDFTSLFRLPPSRRPLVADERGVRNPGAEQQPGRARGPPPRSLASDPRAAARRPATRVARTACCRRPPPRPRRRRLAPPRPRPASRRCRTRSRCRWGSDGTRAPRATSTARSAPKPERGVRRRLVG